jgi:hypothetical protein
LDKRRFNFSLPTISNFFDMSPLYGFDNLFLYYQSCDICERRGFAEI